jgi:hypothetical protein
MFVSAASLLLAIGLFPPQASAAGGPSELVSQALAAESKGQADERNALLRQAVVADPDHPAARGLLGEWADGGAWRSAADPVSPDPALAAAHETYQARRTKLLAEESAARERLKAMGRLPGRGAECATARAELDRETARNHAGLAAWCDSAGLTTEATAHRIAALRLDPSREATWKDLGYARIDGRWVTPDEARDAKADAEAQKKADRTWEPALRQIRARLNGKDERLKERARADLDAITDPRAVPSIMKVLGRGDEDDQRLAVRLLARFESRLATRALAALALGTTSDRVRSAACDVLRNREPRDYAEELVGQITEPWTWKILAPVAGPGTRGSLLVESPRFSLVKVYDAPEPFQTTGPNAPAVVGFGPRGLPFAMNRIDLMEYSTFIQKPKNHVIALMRGENRMQGLIAESQVKAQASEQVMASDIQAIDARNAEAAVINGQVIPILQATLDAPANLGNDEEAWARWWYEQNGYTYEPSPRVEVYQEIPILPPPIITGGLTAGLMSCFAAGTPVRTPDGRRPIESLQVGDLVLAQDTTTGALGFRPIVATYHNPPLATLRLVLDGDETHPIVATTYHRFWVAGEGWRMARELKSGDMVRTLGRTARVTGVHPDATVPVFNLCVADDATYFVGESDALVHDNSLPDPHATRFDARSPSVSNVVASTTGRLLP